MKRLHIEITPPGEDMGEEEREAHTEHVKNSARDRHDRQTRQTGRQLALHNNIDKRTHDTTCPRQDDQARSSSTARKKEYAPGQRDYQHQEEAPFRHRALCV